MKKKVLVIILFALMLIGAEKSEASEAESLQLMIPHIAYPAMTYPKNFKAVIKVEIEDFPSGQDFVQTYRVRGNVVNSITMTRIQKSEIEFIKGVKNAAVGFNHEVQGIGFSRKFMVELSSSHEIEIRITPCIIQISEALFSFLLPRYELEMSVVGYVCNKLLIDYLGEEVDIRISHKKSEQKGGQLK